MVMYLCVCCQTGHVTRRRPEEGMQSLPPLLPLAKRSQFVKPGGQIVIGPRIGRVLHVVNINMDAMVMIVFSLPSYAIAVSRVCWVAYAVK